MSKREDNVLAQLGIQLERPAAQAISGLSPTDEELACLFEGSIGEPRKSEILTHIARSESAYLRWKNCVEINTYAQEIEQEDLVRQKNPVAPAEPKKRNKPKSQSLLDKFSHLIFGKNPMILGGGLATAASIVFVTTLVINNPSEENIGMDIESLYKSYEVTLSQSWNKNTHTKHSATFSSSRSFFSAEKSSERKLIEAGYKNGINLLDSKMFTDIGINKENLTETPADRNHSEMVLFNLGKVNAITTLQCEQQMNAQQTAKQFTHNDLIMKDIIKSLDKVNTSEIQEIKLAFNDSSKNITERICTTNYAIVKLISK